jgi:hypothetical protein
MLKELEPERYPNPEQVMSCQKMKVALAGIRCEEPEKVEAEKMVEFFMFISAGA